MIVPVASNTALGKTGAVLSGATIDLTAEICPALSFAVTLTVSLLTNAAVRLIE